ncbi:unnamed protein product [Cylindrotheca closterium]|uniref:Uncharacterized protein n=1 Tax=Cylindrotheca closterium TaxID=2856 RepID=A0AAD2FLA1_9STRA|nr:unnamed protein product [Cylindrotheca closterium]
MEEYIAEVAEGSETTEEEYVEEELNVEDGLPTVMEVDTERSEAASEAPLSPVTPKSQSAKASSLGATEAPAESLIGRERVDDDFLKQRGKLAMMPLMNQYLSSRNRLILCKN